MVEAEFSALLPDGVGMPVTRLTGEANDARARFYEYIDNLETSLKLWQGADRCRGFLTATAYLPDVDQDARLAAMSEKVGYPIISSSQPFIGPTAAWRNTPGAVQPLPQLADRIE